MESTKPSPNGQKEDEIKLWGKAYKLRFRPKDAEHVMDNYTEKDHRIKHREIQTLLRDSIFLKKNIHEMLCLGKHKERYYKTTLSISKDELLIKTCFLSEPQNLKNELLKFGI